MGMLCGCVSMETNLYKQAAQERAGPCVSDILENRPVFIYWKFKKKCNYTFCCILPHVKGGAQALEWTHSIMCIFH